jgi:hypothetical protein
VTRFPISMPPRKEVIDAHDAAPYLVGDNQPDQRIDHGNTPIIREPVEEQITALSAATADQTPRCRRPGRSHERAMALVVYVAHPGYDERATIEPVPDKKERSHGSRPREKCRWQEGNRVLKGKAPSCRTPTPERLHGSLFADEAGPCSCVQLVSVAFGEEPHGQQKQRIKGDER